MLHVNCLSRRWTNRAIVSYSYYFALICVIYILWYRFCDVVSPHVLHYGLLWEVKGTAYTFDKHWHFDFDPFLCPPWNLRCAKILK